jgi:hypothetical protein
MALLFTIAAGRRQRSHSEVRVPRDSQPHFTVSDLRLPQPVGPGPRIYIPPGTAGPVIPPGTGLRILETLRTSRLKHLNRTEEYCIPKT